MLLSACSSYSCRARGFEGLSDGLRFHTATLMMVMVLHSSADPWKWVGLHIHFSEALGALMTFCVPEWVLRTRMLLW
jgi:hypothetical protein